MHTSEGDPELSSEWCDVDLSFHRGAYVGGQGYRDGMHQLEVDDSTLKQLGNRGCMQASEKRNSQLGLYDLGIQCCQNVGR